MKAKIILLLGLLACSTSIFAQISRTVVPTTPFAGGNGTLADPYRISTAVQFDSVRRYLASNFVVINDIDLNVAPYNTGAGFEPIGYYTSSSDYAFFSGNFEGDGYAIKNLYINRASTSYVALFGYTNGATIDSIGLTNCNVKGSLNVGGLVGWSKSSTISNSYAKGEVSGAGYLGILIARTLSSSVTIKCSANGKITGTGGFVGGLVGDNSASITSCFAHVNVVSTSGDAIGGLVGCNSNAGTIIDCYATGNVLARSYVGGLVGNNSYGGTISKCYATGNILGKEYIGGLVGYNESSPISNCYATGSVHGTVNHIGGLVGYNYFSGSTISKSYAVGYVSGNGSFIGGLVGDNVSASISDSFYDIGTTGQSNSSYNGIPKYTAEMKVQSTFTNWNFTTIWGIRTDSIYPSIRSISNNAPFAFRDTIIVNKTALLVDLLKNDFDPETLDTFLVLKVDSLCGTGSTDFKTSFSFPVDKKTGFADSLVYRIGEKLISGDTLWGNRAIAVLVCDTLAPSALNDIVSTSEDVMIEVAVLDNDIDGTDDILTVSKPSSVYPKHGSAVVLSNKVRYTPAANWSGIDSVRYIVSDGVLTDTAYAIITVTPVNDAPVITSVAQTTATEDVNYIYTIIATDVEGSTLTYSLNNQPAGMTISGNVISWTPTEGITTSGAVTLTVSDGSLTDVEIFTIAVTAVNDAPIITSVAPTTATVGVIYTYTIVATDVDNTSLTYTFSGQPAGMTIIGNLISWTPANGVSTSGAVTLTVSDGNLSDTEIFTVIVSPTTSVATTNFNDVSLYPNPTSDGFYVDAGSKISQLHVFDLIGRTVHTQRICDKSYVDISALPKGIYLVKVNGKIIKIEKR